MADKPERKMLPQRVNSPHLPKKELLPTVHPFARMVAGLLSPMSLEDQRWAYSFSCHAIFGTFIVSFPIAYAVQNVFFCVYSILVAACVSAVVCLPNWRQNIDYNLTFEADEKVDAYYKKLTAARESMKESVSSGGKDIKIE
ncbi:unnamed protein product [Phytomonas sp. EM1]|nr:unnamed protein product [Phytomonas sp. EM1]|eukprot:CCW64304.1 unnamed protein product [Phytomonas sp. isolate EM1]